MSKTNKTKTNARRAFRATRAALKQLAESELALAVRRRENLPNLEFAPLQFCTLALNSK